MLNFIVKRVLKGIVCVWFIWTMIFFLVRLTGDPTDWMLPDGATDQEIANLRSSLHLDEPITKQYVDSLMDMFHGDAGNSYYYKRDVVELYNERLFTTLKLAIPGFAFAITFVGTGDLILAGRVGVDFKLPAGQVLSVFRRLCNSQITGG